MKNQKTILLVDDEEAIRVSLAFNLKHCGFQVVTAADGRAGLDRLQEKDIDLVITDLMMGENGGLQFLQEIRKDDPGLPVIILTGYGDLPSAIQGLRQGAMDYLLKPCDLEELLASINHALDERVVARPSLCSRQGRALSLKQDFLEEALHKSQREIKEKERLLGEANSALRLLLKNISEEKEEQKKQIVQQLNKTVLPYVHRLELSTLNKQQQLLLATIHSQIEHLTSFTSKRGSDIYLQLTPMETKVANLIRVGQSTKEIAALLNLSIRTVETHRQNIRKKAGLRNKNGNLQTILSAN